MLGCAYELRRPAKLTIRIRFEEAQSRLVTRYERHAENFLATTERELIFLDISPRPQPHLLATECLAGAARGVP